MSTPSPPTPDPRPYAHAVVDALRAAGVLTREPETSLSPPAIALTLDPGQCADRGYAHPIRLEWNSVDGWRYGPIAPDDPDSVLWAMYIGVELLPPPIEVAGLVDRHILHTTRLEAPRYRTDDTALAEQLERVAMVLPLPEVGWLLADDPLWTYPSGTLTSGIARLRIWTVPTGGHLAIVTDQDMGTSITNAAEHVWKTLVDRVGEPLWLLEHYPASKNVPDDGGTLDQVELADGEATWRRIWPVAPGFPGHYQALAWMRTCGYEMLDS
ncbi:hypothetical protein [Amycolatopsis thailandensis]|uniref:hypothetical protein n=1 Tax=Amycolatopsis thailandensis TaxID=589330 RepID=UPI003639844A